MIERFEEKKKTRFRQKKKEIKHANNQEKKVRNKDLDKLSSMQKQVLRSYFVSLTNSHFSKAVTKWDVTLGNIVYVDII